MALTLQSPDFDHGGSIPSKFTCEGEDRSPALKWSGAPAGTTSYVLIVDDPDAPDPAKPQRVWVHWVLYNMSAEARDLPENVSSSELPDGTNEGVNDWNRTGYGGPCPPIGEHRYFFKLYALDTMLSGLSKPTKAQLLEAMEGHVLEHVELLGTYKKKRA